MLEEDFQFFTDNQKELFSKYPNRYLVIQNQSVLFDTATIVDALNKAASKGLKSGEYIVQKCSEGVEAFTQVYHSRVAFCV